MDVEDYRRTSREVWEAMAPGWERWRAQLTEALTPVREWLIGELEPQPGETVLELGAGVGDTGFKAAAILGEDGRLISTDFCPEMVEVARRRGTELGLGNVDYRVTDAERIELDSGSVDGVLCQSTYMLVADPAAALAATRRLLRPRRQPGALGVERPAAFDARAVTAGLCAPSSRALLQCRREQAFPPPTRHPRHGRGPGATVETAASRRMEPSASSLADGRFAAGMDD